jgi:hypothetical protein
MTWTCQCPRELDEAIPRCGSCLMEQLPTSTSLLSRCEACGSPTRPSQLTTASADPGNDHAVSRCHRCASCHIAYLKRRAELDPISPGDLARCRAALAASFARAEAKWTTRR